jgi:transcription termination factor Rho
VRARGEKNEGQERKSQGSKGRVADWGGRRGEGRMKGRRKVEKWGEEGRGQNETKNEGGRMRGRREGEEGGEEKRGQNEGKKKGEEWGEEGKGNMKEEEGDGGGKERKKEGRRREEGGKEEWFQKLLGKKIFFCPNSKKTSLKLDWVYA